MDLLRYLEALGKISAVVIYLLHSLLVYFKFNWRESPSSSLTGVYQYYWKLLVAHRNRLSTCVANSTGSSNSFFIILGLILCLKICGIIPVCYLSCELWRDVINISNTQEELLSQDPFGPGWFQVRTSTHTSDKIWWRAECIPSSLLLHLICILQVSSWLKLYVSLFKSLFLCEISKFG